jgi:hypothetical protein
MLKVKLYCALQNKARWLRWLFVIARCLPVAGGAVAFQRILVYQVTDAAGMSAITLGESAVRRPCSGCVSRRVNLMTWRSRGRK